MALQEQQRRSCLGAFPHSVRSIVHHVAVFEVNAANADAARKKDADEAGPGYTCFGGAGVGGSQLVVGWAVGGGVSRLDDNQGLPVRKGSIFVIQVHYNLVNHKGRGGIPTPNKVYPWLQAHGIACLSIHKKVPAAVFRAPKPAVSAFLRALFSHQVTGSDTGYLLRVAAGAERQMLPKIMIKGVVTVDYASDDYMQAYFGVTPVQSTRSGLATFDAGAGFKSIGALLSTEYALTRDWKLLASAGYTRSLGDAASSPITEAADRFEARLGASRSFDWKMGQY